AYALYLQARELVRQVTPEAFAKSDALYRQVLEIDPRYAPAWERLGNNLLHKKNTRGLSRQEGYGPARRAAGNARGIHPDHAPAHRTLGEIAMVDNDPAGAARHFQRALELDPTDVAVLGNASVFLVSLGRLDEALALEEAVVRRDPVNVTGLHNLGIDQRM